MLISCCIVLYCITCTYNIHTIYICTHTLQLVWSSHCEGHPPSYDMALSLMPPKASGLARSCSWQDGWLSSSGSQYQECPSLEVWFCSSVLKMSEQCIKVEVCGSRNVQITAVRRQRAPVLTILSLSPIYWVGAPSLCPYSGHLLLPQVILFGNAPTDKLWRMPFESSIQFPNLIKLTRLSSYNITNFNFPLLNCPSLTPHSDLFLLIDLIDCQPFLA